MSETHETVKDCTGCARLGRVEAALYALLDLHKKMEQERDEWRDEWKGAYENASRWKRERDAYKNGNRDLHDENQRLRRERDDALDMAEAEHTYASIVKAENESMRRERDEAQALLARLGITAYVVQREQQADENLSTTPPPVEGNLGDVSPRVHSPDVSPRVHRECETCNGTGKIPNKYSIDGYPCTDCEGMGVQNRVMDCSRIEPGQHTRDIDAGCICCDQPVASDEYRADRDLTECGACGAPRFRDCDPDCPALKDYRVQNLDTKHVHVEDSYPQQEGNA